MNSPDRLNFEARKLTPRSHDNHGRVCNLPDTPPIRKIGLGKISFFVPWGSNLEIFVPASLREKRVNQKDHSVRGFKVVPLSEVPLTTPYRTSHGGRRVGGGGTSVEALRRARRKARLNGW